MRFTVVGAIVGTLTSGFWLQSTSGIVLRGRQQSLHLYGSPSGQPVIVSSGDGGWVHLAPHVAELLATKGFYVVGFDVRAYLASFTSATSTLRMEEEPTDYHVLVERATTATSTKPILIGVSEGAGLSVLAATDPHTKSIVAGVIGLGLPDLNELGWRWKDSVIYLTHKVPNEPTFSAAAIIANVGPLPLALVHSTHDEFTSLVDIQNLVKRAAEPRKLWIVNAADHRFSDNLAELDQRLLEAIQWIQAHGPR
jgi:alpha-beta hydrolase superfamily lysophospholipase